MNGPIDHGKLVQVSAVVPTDGDTPIFVDGLGGDLGLPVKIGVDKKRLLASGLALSSLAEDVPMRMKVPAVLASSTRPLSSRLEPELLAVSRFAKILFVFL